MQSPLLLLFVMILNNRQLLRYGTPLMIAIINGFDRDRIYVPDS